MEILEDTALELRTDWKIHKATVTSVFCQGRTVPYKNNAITIQHRPTDHSDPSCQIHEEEQHSDQQSHFGRANGDPSGAVAGILCGSRMECHNTWRKDRMKREKMVI